MAGYRKQVAFLIFLLLISFPIRSKEENIGVSDGHGPEMYTTEKLYALNGKR